VATTLYTIGFTKSSAEHFFTRLRATGVRRLIDVRLNNVSQLDGFARRDHLEFLLRAVWSLEIEYIHEPMLTPDEAMLKAYRGKQLAWEAYADRYEALIANRGVSTVLDRNLFAGPSVLLCSEATPDHCHRRLAAEHLARAWGDLDIVHL
jgi:uncharacterized protein (DUF488 family)